MNHSFDIDEAQKHGVECAIILNNVRHWIAYNKANGINIIDGRVWTFNSVRAYSELFPYWSTDQIRRYIEKLEKSGALIVGSYNKRGGGRLNMDWDVHCYSCVLPDIGKVRTPTDEKVGIYKVLRLPENTLPSVRYLVPMALDPKVGSADIAYTERDVKHKSIHDIEKSRIIALHKGKL